MADGERRDMRSFRRDRNEALLSMDRATILKYMAKYGETWEPSCDEVFLRSIHKARTACRDLPIAERRKSKKWLEARGSESWDDGDL